MKDHFEQYPSDQRRFTAIVSQVDVEDPVWSDDSGQVVVFVSKWGLPEELLGNLPKNVVVIQATFNSENDGHAEDAAAAFRADVAGQESELGGKIGSVGNTWVSSGICTEHCADALNEYIYNGTPNGPTVKAGDMGIINGEVETRDTLKSNYGNSNAVDNVIEEVERKPTLAQIQQQELDQEINEISNNIVNGNSSVGSGDDEDISDDFD